MAESPGTRAARTAARRRAILDAALQCFIERGYEATTVDDVRGASGASIGSIYHHFRSKEDLAAELYLDGYRSFGVAVADVLARGRSVEHTIRAIAVVPIRWARRN